MNARAEPDLLAPLSNAHLDALEEEAIRHACAGLREPPKSGEEGEGSPLGPSYGCDILRARD